MSSPLQPPPGHDLACWTLFKGAGIFAVSVSGHSSLPAVRNSMRRPEVRLAATHMAAACSLQRCA